MDVSRLQSDRALRGVVEIDLDDLLGRVPARISVTVIVSECQGLSTPSTLKKYFGPSLGCGAAFIGLS
jgi:hypothetical protein